MLRSASELEERIMQLGFLPFFRNSIRGFSIQEMVDPRLWFSDEEGPWEWKGPVIRNLNCAYGKFFNGKAGYISLDWFPDFANYRRSLRPVDTGASNPGTGISERMILDTIRAHESLLSKELKDLCGLKSANKRRKFDLIDTLEPAPVAVNRRRGGLEPALTGLQMSTRIVIADFEYNISRSGEPYGWGVARYTTPEALYGEEILTACEGRDPHESRERIIRQLSTVFPDTPAAKLLKIVDTIR